jgi:hypothetical protein
MRAAIVEGRIPANLDITQNLVEAAKLVSQARAEGEKLIDAIRQRDILGGGITPWAERILRDWMFDGDKLTRRIGRDKIADAIANYADTARMQRRAGLEPQTIEERIALAGLSTSSFREPSHKPRPQKQR